MLAPADETGQDHARVDLTMPATEEQSGKTTQAPEAAKSQVPLWGAACAAACSVGICERCPHRMRRQKCRRGSGLLGDVFAEVEFDALGLLQAACEEAALVIRGLRTPCRAPEGGQGGCVVFRRNRCGRVDELRSYLNHEQ